MTSYLLLAGLLALSASSQNTENASTTLQTRTTSTSPTSVQQTSPTTGIPSTPRPIQAADFEYYYYILIVFGLILLAFLFYACNFRKRKRQSLALRRRQSALSQDLEGYTPRRAWLDRAYGGRNENTSVGVDEGLDERGEAPPPYANKASEEQQGVQLPLRAMTKPPEYQKSYRPVAVDVVTGMGQRSGISDDSAQHATVWEDSPLHHGEQSREHGRPPAGTAAFPP